MVVVVVVLLVTKCVCLIVECWLAKHCAQSAGTARNNNKSGEEECWPLTCMSVCHVCLYVMYDACCMSFLYVVCNVCHECNN